MPFFTCEILISEQEYSPHIDAVFDAMKDDGWIITEISWTLAGSQELITYSAKRENVSATILCETYMGARLTTKKKWAKYFDKYRVTT